MISTHPLDVARRIGWYFGKDLASVLANSCPSVPRKWQQLGLECKLRLNLAGIYEDMHEWRAAEFASKQGFDSVAPDGD